MTPKEAIHSIRKNIPNANKSNPSVSKVNVAWHLDHSLKVIIAITETLKNSKPANYNPKFSILKSIIMFTGFIPRGKARAPKAVNNKENISIESIEKQLEYAEKLLAEVKKLPENSYYTHHMFGDLNLASTLKFIGIHSNHHLKIVKDIIK